MTYKENIKLEIARLLKTTKFELEARLHDLDKSVVLDITKVSSIEDLETIKNSLRYKEWENVKSTIVCLQKAIDCLEETRDRDFFLRYIDCINI